MTLSRMLAGCAAAVILMFLCCAGADALGVSGTLRSFGENAILAEQERGTAGTIEILQGSCVMQAFSWSGEAEIGWNGLGYFEEPLPSGDYRIRGTFQDGNGNEWTEETGFHFSAPLSAVLYALPYPEKVPVEALDSFCVETACSASGMLTLICEDMEGREQFRVSREMPALGEQGRIRPGKTRMGRLKKGLYRLRLHTDRVPEWEKSCIIEILGEPAENLEVGPTGPVFPDEDMDDDAVWEVMQKPSAVVNIGNISHQNVYEEKREKSRILGTLHGQSQALEVLETDGGWAKIRACRHEDGAWVEGYVPLQKLMMVRPHPEWGILVSMEDQTAAIYHQGKRLCTVPVSTGLPAEKKAFRETARGAFLTDEHINGFAEDFYHYEYPIRYDGGNLMHQVGWQKMDGNRDTSAQAALLGEKASHGCIRLPPANPVFSAYRAWSTLPRGTRILIMDRAPASALSGGEEAEQVSVPETLSAPVWAWEEGSLPIPELDGDEGLIDLAESRTLEQVPGAREDAEIVITSGGDVALGTRENWWRRQDALPAVLEKAGLEYPLSGLSSLFSVDDATLVNLECVLKKDSRGEKTEKMYRFRGMPSYAGTLSAAGVEYACIANNHFIDYGAQGQRETCAALEAAGIGYFGYGTCAIIEKSGYRIGLCGIRETVFLRTPEQLDSDIRTLKEAGADVIICMCHWGTEYAPNHNATQMQMAQYAARAGADLILGGHPHVVQGIEIVDGSLVLWSHGNLMFGGTIRLSTFDGLISRWTLHMADGGLKSADLELIPVLTSSKAGDGINDYHPVPAEGEDAGRILEKIQADSAMQVETRMCFLRENGQFVLKSNE